MRRIFELLAHRAVNPPPSSSLAEERRLRSLLCALLAPLARLALGSRCLPHSPADEERVCSLVQDSGAPA
jgi:hypothetical protein